MPLRIVKRIIIVVKTFTHITWNENNKLLVLKVQTVVLQWCGLVTSQCLVHWKNWLGCIWNLATMTKHQWNLWQLPDGEIKVHFKFKKMKLCTLNNKKLWNHNVSISVNYICDETEVATNFFWHKSIPQSIAQQRALMLTGFVIEHVHFIL